MKFEDMINTITLGNSYELIKSIPDKNIDLILIDPPYDFHCGSVAGIFKNRIVKPGIEIVEKNINHGFDMNILQEFVRVLKKHKYILMV